MKTIHRDSALQGGCLLGSALSMLVLPAAAYADEAAEAATGPEIVVTGIRADDANPNANPNFTQRLIARHGESLPLKLSCRLNVKRPYASTMSPAQVSITISICPGAESLSCVLYRSGR